MTTHARRALALSAQPIRQDWYRIGPVMAATPEDPKVADVYVFDAIGGWMGVNADDFVRDVAGLDVERIVLHLNTPGGDVFEGVAMANVLRAHPASVTVVVDGLAASAGSVVAMAGDEIVMGVGSQMMIHDAWGLSVGNAADMAKMAESLSSVSDSIASTYAARAGGTAADWRATMIAETWYTAEEAVAAGLADRVATEADKGTATGQQVTPGGGAGLFDWWDSLSARDRFDLSVFSHAGRENAPAPRSPAATASGLISITQEGSRPVAFTDEQLTTMRQRLGVAATADEATILAALDEALQEHAVPPSEATADAWRAEAQRLSTEVAEIKAERAREAKDRARQAKDNFFADMSRTGRLKPADRAELERQYDEAPQVVRNIVSARAAGSEVPVAELGYTGGTESADPTVDDVRETPAYKNWRA